MALSEHAHVADEDLAPLGIQSAAGLAPSLHLNLGDGYLRQGRVDAAGVQLAAGLEAWAPSPRRIRGADPFRPGPAAAPYRGSSKPLTPPAALCRRSTDLRHRLSVTCNSSS